MHTNQGLFISFTLIIRAERELTINFNDEIAIIETDSGDFIYVHG